MSTENIVLMLLFPPSGSWLKPPCSKPRPYSDLGHSRVWLPFWQPCHRWTNLSWSDWIDLRIMMLMMYPQLSTPYLATSPQVQNLHFWLTTSTRTFSFPTENTQKKKLRNRNRNTQKTCNRMQSFGEVHLELKSCPVLDQQHPILSLYRHFADCSLYTDLQIMKLPFYVQLYTMSSPWQ